MSSRPHSVVDLSITSTDPGLQEHVQPIGVLPLLAIDNEPTPSPQPSINENSGRLKLYETSTANEISPTLEAPDLPGQPMIQSANFGDPPSFLVSFQDGAILMEIATSRDSNLHPGGGLPHYPSKTAYDSPEIGNSTFHSGSSTAQENTTLLFSSPYSLSRHLRIDPHNEPLRHEVDIAVSEGRIRGGQNMFIQRVVELMCGIDTLFNE